MRWVLATILILGSITFAVPTTTAQGSALQLTAQQPSIPDALPATYETRIELTLYHPGPGVCACA